ncbi:MAG: adenylate/guanylate cyclase domain-containing protein, partial [Hyphomicrobiales bacterium]
LVAGISWLGAREIVGSLGSGLINQGLSRLELALRRELDAVNHQAAYVAQAFARGLYGFDQPERLSDFLAGSVAAAPQIGTMVVGDTRGHALRLTRETRGAPAVVEAIEVKPGSGLARLAARAAEAGTALWRDPVYLEQAKSTILGLTVPLRNGDIRLGFMAAGVFSRTLSEDLRDGNRTGRFTPFLLLGTDRVIAHPNLADGEHPVSAGKPLLGIAEVGDPVLAKLAEARPMDGASFKLAEGSQALQVSVGGADHQIFLRPITGYGDATFHVGVHLAQSRLSQTVTALKHQGLIGIALLFAAFGLSVVLSRAISLPIRRAAKGVSKVRTLDFEQVEPLPRSSLREVDELASAFNAMLVGLKSFGRYMPRRLVAGLIRENRVGAGSEERALTVMFTDMAGFSGISETMSARELAAFLNEHLALITGAIEAEGGTIDKYIGDAVMAFWGAPDRLDNTAEPAARAAIAIREALARDNAERRARGELPLRLRIGVHTGPLVVGDIGSPQRINYTVVGDVVNGAQRLEALGKELAPEAEIVILMSGETEKLLPADFSRKARGAHRVKGKEHPLEVFELV